MLIFPRYLGVKVKSCKTQTYASAPLKQLAVLKPQYLFSPSEQQQEPGLPLQGYLIPMAIPLGEFQFLLRHQKALLLREVYNCSFISP